MCVSANEHAASSHTVQRTRRRSDKIMICFYVFCVTILVGQRHRAAHFKKSKISFLTLGVVQEEVLRTFVSMMVVVVLRRIILLY